MPFDNVLESAYLTGAHVKLLLEYALTLSPEWHLCDEVRPSQCAPDDCGESGMYCYENGGWPQFYGLRWSYNVATQDVISVDVYERATGLWYSIVDDISYKFVTDNYIMGGGDGYDVLTTFATEITELPLDIFAAAESFMRATPLVYQGLSGSFGAGSPSLSVYAQSSTDQYKACDVTSPLGLSDASLPLRSTVCNSISVAATADDYEEPPYEVSIVVMANTHFDLLAVQHALSMINNESSVLPFTELCSFTAMADNAEEMETWFVDTSSSLASCASGRVPTTTAKVAGILGPPSVDAVGASNTFGLPFVLFDTVDSSLLSTDLPYVITAAPNNDDFATALVALLSHYSWTSALALYTTEYADLANRFEAIAAIASQSITKLSLLDTSIDAALNDYPDQRIILLFANAGDTRTGLLSVSANGLINSGYAYITLSKVGSLVMDGVIVLSKPFNTSEYISDALWAAAYGINNLVESGMSRKLPNGMNIQSALTNAEVLHSSIASNTFTSSATEASVVFSPSGRLESQKLDFLSVRDGATAKVGTWSMDEFSVTVGFWPGSQTKQPTVGCPAGQYFDANLDCVDCDAGTFASGAGIRFSCNDCAVGTFAGGGGSVSCMSCEYGHVAMEKGLPSCTEIPSGTTWINASALRVKPGNWRPEGGKLSDVYECPIVEACPGGGGYDAALCAEGFVGPLCSHCDSDHFISWSVVIC